MRLSVLISAFKVNVWLVRLLVVVLLCCYTLAIIQLIHPFYMSKPAKFQALFCTFTRRNYCISIRPLSVIHNTSSESEGKYSPFFYNCKHFGVKSKNI